MKSLQLLLLCVPFLCFANTTEPTPSSIKKVTVYLEGASIERISETQILKGTTTIYFSNLSPDIDEKSIQISGLKDATIQSLSFHINYLEQKELSEEYKKLEQEIKNLNFQKNNIQGIMEGLNEELSLLRQNQRINSDATDLVLEKVKELSKYYRLRTAEIKTEIYTQQHMLDEIFEQIRKHQNELLKLDDSNKEQQGEIMLVVNSKKTQSLSLTIKYNIATAGWFPTYDIKAKNTVAPIEMSYKAHIYQQSGSDWNNVNLTLSTGDPNTNNTKPIISTHFLQYTSAGYRNNNAVKTDIYKYNPTIRTVSGTVVDENGLPISEVNVLEKGTSNEVKTNFDGKFTLQVGGGRALEFSNLGYITEQIPIYSSTISPALRFEPNPPYSFVETASEVQKNKKALGYSVSSTLSGKAAGLDITNQSGLSGTANGVVIRGTNSFSGDNNALYVIDGVPISKSKNEKNLNGNWGSTRDFDIDPDNIARVDILKGLAATSLYGSEGREGVILITTKSGNAEYLSTGNYKEQGITNTTFEIKDTYSILSNAEITVVEVDNFSLPATYQHYVAPELNENVFLTATIKNWEQFDLLAGEANIYFEDAYAGKTNISPVATTNALIISLGIDPNVIVKRKRLNNFKSKSFLGSNRIINKGYTVEIKNNKTSQITLSLEDRIPVSQNKEIKVSDIETDDANYDDESGILSWKITLEPEQSMKKQFRYQVKYPKYKHINL